jgi:hypothetical protein
VLPQFECHRVFPLKNCLDFDSAVRGQFDMSEATENTVRIRNIVPSDLVGNVKDVDRLVTEFCNACEPLEKDELLYVFVDHKTGARFCECHISADKLVSLGTVDVPLDPDEQEEYRANRELVIAHHAFERMKTDAVERRTFSNLVLEYSTEYTPESPLKVIGGQHRFTAIQQARESGINEYHGVKVYFGLDKAQRYDVQLISNTVIGVSLDLYDRMQETSRGPQLRNWAQEVGLLGDGEDFTDKRQRGKMINVRLVRSFILSYYAGKEINSIDFDKLETTPEISASGKTDPNWEATAVQIEIWQDEQLKEAGRQFAKLILAQRNAFTDKSDADFADKATNYAVASGYAFVSGVLHNNSERLSRHYQLSSRTGKDPLNVKALIDKGRHKSDDAGYRGMGYRGDPKEAGRFVELFFLQAEDGKGISPAAVDLAVKKHVQKKNFLDVQESQRKYEASIN